MSISINNNEQMLLQVENEMLSAYQDMTQLSLFAGVDIGSIGIEQWYHKNMEDIPEAALTLAGFNPQEVGLAASLFGNHVLTAAESLNATEKIWAQWQRVGMDVEGVRMIGEKVAQTANKYLWLGTDSEGNQPIVQYNFIKDPGAGNGALNRPLIHTNATVGGWSTWLNMSKDITRLISELVRHGYNKASTVVFYPESGEYLMNLTGGGTNEVSAMQLLTNRGIMAVPIADSLLYTLAGATPTDVLFDLFAIDLSTIKIGYTRTERTRVIPPHNDVRDTKAEAEVWFTPYIVPKPWAGDSKIYKGVSRISAIAP